MEGLPSQARWLAANQHIDGLYLDDIAFSRATVKRLAAVLHESRPEVVIDLHSANQFNVRDGFINSAMLYMEHFPSSRACGSASTSTTTRARTTG